MKPNHRECLRDLPDYSEGMDIDMDAEVVPTFFGIHAYEFRDVLNELQELGAVGHRWWKLPALPGGGNEMWPIFVEEVEAKLQHRSKTGVSEVIVYSAGALYMRLVTRTWCLECSKRIEHCKNYNPAQAAWADSLVAKATQPS